MNNETDATIEELTPEVEESVPVVEELEPAPVPETEPVTTPETNPEPTTPPELKEADIVVSEITTDPVQEPKEPVEIDGTTTIIPIPEDVKEEPVAEESTDEPVMIAIVDEVVEETTPETNPPVEVPVVPPELGQPEIPVDDNNVPAFQTFPEETSNEPVVEEQVTTPEPVVEEAAPTEEPVVEPSTESITVPAPQEQTETYQASSQTEVVPTFQQMPEAPTTPEQTEGVTLDEEEPIVEDKPNTIRKIIPLIIVGLIIATIAGFIYVSMNNVPTKTTDKETLIPVRSENGKTNVLIVGTNESKKWTIYPSLVGITENDIKECPSEKNRLEYHLIKKDATYNGTDYNVVYPCNLSSTFNYMIDSEGDNTIDGAVLIINADQENVVQAKAFMESLSKTGVKKLVVYIVGSLNVEFIARDIRDAISETGFENNTPVLISTNSNIDELKAKINQTIIREDPSDGPSAIQSHKSIKLYTHFLSKEEGGMEEELKGDVILNLEIGSEYYTVKLTVPKDADPIKPGDNGEISVELDRQLPLETGIRVQVYKESKVIGLGVISELN